MVVGHEELFPTTVDIHDTILCLLTEHRGHEMGHRSNDTILVLLNHAGLGRIETDGSMLL